MRPQKSVCQQPICLCGTLGHIQYLRCFSVERIIIFSLGFVWELVRIIYDFFAMPIKHFEFRTLFSVMSVTDWWWKNNSSIMVREHGVSFETAMLSMGINIIHLILTSHEYYTLSVKNIDTFLISCFDHSPSEWYTYTIQSPGQSVMERAGVLNILYNHQKLFSVPGRDFCCCCWQKSIISCLTPGTLKPYHLCISPTLTYPHPHGWPSLGLPWH